MNFFLKSLLPLTLATVALAPLAAIRPAQAATSTDLDNDSRNALRALTRQNPAAARLAREARAVLVFPNIVKAGFVFGAAYGEGELLQHNVVDGYYNSVSASWGLQAGAQSYGYVVFLMTEKAVRYIHETHGWEIGTGPSVVVVNEGIGKNLTTSTLKDDAYAFVFDQQGLMASLSIEGTKISHIKQ